MAIWDWLDFAAALTGRSIRVEGVVYWLHLVTIHHPLSATHLPLFSISPLFSLSTPPPLSTSLQNDYKLRFVPRIANNERYLNDAKLKTPSLKLFMSNAALAQTLIRAVDEADSATRLVQAVQQLANARLVETVPTLIATLRYNNPGAAVAAVDGLIAIGKPAVQPLLDLLDGHNYTARAWAIRAMAGIGDARGLDVLMAAAQHDFALSVRRAAARGLGTVHWEELEVEQAKVAQVNACNVLMGLGQDPEWVVRYAAIAGLQALAQATTETQPALVSTILTHLQQLTDTDPDAGIRIRATRALQVLQTLDGCQSEEQPVVTTVEMNWRLTLEKLYDRKLQERMTLPEGDPRRYQDLAVALTEAVKSL